MNMTAEEKVDRQSRERMNIFQGTYRPPRARIKRKKREARRTEELDRRLWKVKRQFEQENEKKKAPGEGAFRYELLPYPLGKRWQKDMARAQRRLNQAVRRRRLPHESRSDNP